MLCLSASGWGELECKGKQTIKDKQVSPKSRPVCRTDSQLPVRLVSPLGTPLTVEAIFQDGPSDSHLLEFTPWAGLFHSKADLYNQWDVVGMGICDS